MVYDDKQMALIRAAVHAVARDGLERTTTRSIGKVAGINDAYIYRYFKDKEDLLCRAYVLLNERMIGLLMDRIGELGKQSIENGRDRFAYVVRGLWDVLIQDTDACLFCDYYYHSASYKKYAAEAHRALTLRMLDKLSEGYTIGAQAEYSLYYLMESIFCFAARAADDRYPAGEDAFGQMIDRLYPIFQSAGA